MPEQLTAARELTTVELDVVWEHLGLGPAPTVLRLPSPGRTERERHAVRTGVWWSLADRGLADRQLTGPDPELTRLLSVLARPDRHVELRGGRDRSLRALAAERTGSAAIAVRRGDAVTVEACGSLPTAVLGVLPPAAPGPGYAVTLPSDTLAAALAAPRSGLRSTLIAGGVPTSDAGLLARMLAPGGGTAQIVAPLLDGIVTVHDGPAGRYLLTRLTAEDGIEWATVAPADHRTVHHRVAELLELTDRR